MGYPRCDINVGYLNASGAMYPRIYPGFSLAIPGPLRPIPASGSARRTSPGWCQASDLPGQFRLSLDAGLDRDQRSTGLRKFLLLFDNQGVAERVGLRPPWPAPFGPADAGQTRSCTFVEPACPCTGVRIHPIDSTGFLFWRRGWDSNPRAGFTRPSDFESAPL